MHRLTRRALLAGMTCILGLGAVGEAAAANPGGNPTVRIGMIRSMFRDIPETMLAPLSKPFRMLMEQQTGVPGDIDISPDAQTLAARLKEGSVHLGVFYGFEYAWVKENYPELVPMVIAVPTCKIFQACIVVREDCPHQNWAEFEGKKVALPRGSREHCHLFLERFGQGGNASINYQLTTPDSVVDALNDVVDGLADATVVDAGALSSFARLQPGRADQVKILVESEVFPSSVVVYHKGVLSSALLARFREGLRRAHQTPRGRQMMRLFKLTGFTHVPNDYEAQLSAIRKAYPPPQSESEIGGQ